MPFKGIQAKEPSPHPVPKNSPLITSLVTHRVITPRVKNFFFAVCKGASAVVSKNCGHSCGTDSHLRTGTLSSICCCSHWRSPRNHTFSVADIKPCSVSVQLEETGRSHFQSHSESRSSHWMEFFFGDVERVPDLGDVQAQLRCRKHWTGQFPDWKEGKKMQEETGRRRVIG